MTHVIMVPQPKRDRKFSIKHVSGVGRALAAGTRNPNGGPGIRCADPVVEGRPTKAERVAALEFFEAVRAMMIAQRKDELVLKDIKLKIGVKLGFAHDEAIYGPLKVAGLDLVPVQVSSGYGGSCYGLSRDQVERAVRRLRPARANLYRGSWS